MRDKHARAGCGSGSRRERELRFDYNFSLVRVYTDAKAAKLVRAVNT